MKSLAILKICCKTTKPAGRAAHRCARPRAGCALIAEAATWPPSPSCPLPWVGNRVPGGGRAGTCTARPLPARAGRPSCARARRGRSPTWRGRWRSCRRGGLHPVRLGLCFSFLNSWNSSLPVYVPYTTVRPVQPLPIRLRHPEPTLLRCPPLPMLQALYIPLYPIPYTLYPVPCTLYPVPCTIYLYPIPFVSQPTRWTYASSVSIHPHAAGAARITPRPPPHPPPSPLRRRRCTGRLRDGGCGGF
jgi:hypothetical protein